jgi:hypothetical protein
MLFFLILIVHILFLYRFMPPKSAYEKPSLEFFCDALIQEQDKLLQLGLISIAGTSNKSLVA